MVRLSNRVRWGSADLPCDRRHYVARLYSPDTEDLRRRLAWMGTFIESLGAAESQLSATRAALKHDLDSLFGRPTNGSS